MCLGQNPPEEMAERGVAVDGDIYDIVDSIYNLGEMFNVEGWVRAEVTVRCAWKKFREFAPFLADVQSVIYEDEGAGLLVLEAECSTGASNWSCEQSVI